MKKLLLLICMLILATSTTLANNTEDSKQAISAIKEIRYNVEAGINYNNYCNVVSKAGVEVRRYADKYHSPGQDIYPKMFLDMMINPYIDAEKIWHNAIFDYGKLLKGDDMSMLFAKYPVLKTKLEPSYIKDTKGKILFKEYRYENVMRALWTIAAEQEKILDKKPAQ